MSSLFPAYQGDQALGILSLPPGARPHDAVVVAAQKAVQAAAEAAAAAQKAAAAAAAAVAARGYDYAGHPGAPRYLRAPPHVEHEYSVARGGQNELVQHGGYMWGRAPMDALGRQVPAGAAVWARFDMMYAPYAVRNSQSKCPLPAPVSNHGGNYSAASYMTGTTSQWSQEEHSDYLNKMEARFVEGLLCSRLQGQSQGRSQVQVEELDMASVDSQCSSPGIHRVPEMKGLRRGAPSNESNFRSRAKAAVSEQSRGMPNPKGEREEGPTTSRSHSKRPKDEPEESRSRKRVKTEFEAESRAAHGASPRSLEEEPWRRQPVSAKQEPKAEETAMRSPSTSAHLHPESPKEIDFFAKGGAGGPSSLPALASPRSEAEGAGEGPGTERTRQFLAGFPGFVGGPLGGGPKRAAEWWGVGARGGAAQGEGTPQQPSMSLQGGAEGAKRTPPRRKGERQPFDLNKLAEEQMRSGSKDPSGGKDGVRSRWQKVRSQEADKSTNGNLLQLGTGSERKGGYIALPLGEGGPEHALRQVRKRRREESFESPPQHKSGAEALDEKPGETADLPRVAREGPMRVSTTERSAAPPLEPPPEEPPQQVLTTAPAPKSPRPSGPPIPSGGQEEVASAPELDPPGLRRNRSGTPQSNAQRDAATAAAIWYQRWQSAVHHERANQDLGGASPRAARVYRPLAQGALRNGSAERAWTAQVDLLTADSDARHAAAANAEEVDGMDCDGNADGVEGERGVRTAAGVGHAEGARDAEVFPDVEGVRGIQSAEETAQVPQFVGAAATHGVAEGVCTVPDKKEVALGSVEEDMDVAGGLPRAERKRGDGLGTETDSGQFSARGGGAIDGANMGGAASASGSASATAPSKYSLEPINAWKARWQPAAEARMDSGPRLSSGSEAEQAISQARAAMMMAAQDSAAGLQRYHHLAQLLHHQTGGADAPSRPPKHRKRSRAHSQPPIPRGEPEDPAQAALSTQPATSPFRARALSPMSSPPPRPASALAEAAPVWFPTGPREASGESGVGRPVDTNRALIQPGPGSGLGLGRSVDANRALDRLGSGLEVGLGRSVEPNRALDLLGRMGSGSQLGGGPSAGSKASQEATNLALAAPEAALQEFIWTNERERRKQATPKLWKWDLGSKRRRDEKP
ncbi:hypothetical protein KFL_009500010 [Klebsormidium nitens]|uniref:Uncharacterized protein n=1 Tax=Klebsormidium nitens TaxID=105231 RepID=A0A1Y1INH6_KLENI|nr:hypothetical protein KFL_009500010 [Klebsormidium nitens]|eukprot:GAQ92223.1 hypothetical protein KFL_009500010 [Klebsormidium nitens]